MNNREFVRQQEDLARALRRATREERDKVPVQLQTPVERKKSREETRRVERAIEGFMRREERYKARVRNLSVGSY